MLESVTNAFRDFATDGVPASGEYQPDKAVIRRWGRELERAVETFTSNGGLIYATKSQIDADLLHGANSSGWVIGDSTVANNGIYRKSGSSGSGSWAKVADLPYSFIRLSDTGAGTANALHATSDVPVPSSAYSSVMILNVFEANTGAATLSVNGGTARALVDVTGAALVTGALQSAMALLVVDDGTSYRILTDYASAANEALAQQHMEDAQAARDDAEAARDLSQVWASNSVDASGLLPRYATVGSLLADTDMGYVGTSPVYEVDTGVMVWGGPHIYQVAASGASDHHLTTAGGVKLYVMPASDGYFSFAAMNPAADGVTDDYPKLAKLLGLAATGTGVYQSTPGINFPNGQYYMGQTIDLKRSVKLRGNSSGLATDAAALLIFPTNTVGITVNRYNTINGGLDSPATTGADGTFIEGLRLKSTPGSDATKHGIWLRARAALHNVSIDGFSGDGIHIFATGGGTSVTEGNANCFSIDTARIINCNNGVYAQGADANAGQGINIDASSNRLWGIHDNSFLGNTWSGCHVSDNGRDVATSRSAYATYGGLCYHAVPGTSSATLNATQPGTDTSKWRKCTTTSYAIAWTGSNPAGTFRDGGGYRSSNANARVLFVGCYSEAGQGLTWLSVSSIAIGGFLVECPVPSDAGSTIEGRFGGAYTKAFYRSEGADPGGTKTVDATIGGNPANGDVMKFSGADGATVTGDWRLIRDGTGWAFNYANLTKVLRLTGSTETYPLVPQATAIALGSGLGLRAFGRVTYSTSSGIVLPSSGTYAKGDAYLAPNPNAGDYIGFVCTTGGVAGSTAVFKSFGAIAP